MSNYLLRRVRELDLSKINTVSDFVSFAEGDGIASLPENPSPEQFEKMVPLIIQYAIEQQIDPGAFDARENGEDIGNIIDPINMKQVRMIKPGHYQGVFTYQDDAYKFTLMPTGGDNNGPSIDYSPMN